MTDTFAIIQELLADYHIQAIVRDTIITFIINNPFCWAFVFAFIIALIMFRYPRIVACLDRWFGLWPGGGGQTGYNPPPRTFGRY